jgi:hypothetical protein
VDKPVDNYQKTSQTIISNLWITLKSRGISNPVTGDMGDMGI